MADVVHFVAASPHTAPRGFGAGRISATPDCGAVALVIKPTGHIPELRLRLDGSGCGSCLAGEINHATDRLLRWDSRHG